MSRLDTYCPPPVSSRASSRRTTGVPNRGTVGHAMQPRIPTPPRRGDGYDRPVQGGREDGQLGGRDRRPIEAAAIVVFLAAAAAGAGALRGDREAASQRDAWGVVAPAFIAIIGLAAIISIAAFGYAAWVQRWKAEEEATSPRPWWAKVGVIVVIVLVLLAAFMFVTSATGTREPPQLPGTNTTSTTLS